MGTQATNRWRIYQAPFLVGALVLSVFLTWNVNRWLGLREDQRTHLTHLAERLTIYFDITLHQNDDVLQRPDRLRRALAELERQDGLLDAVAVRRGGRLLASVGDPITECGGEPGEWERPDGRLVVARPIRRSAEESLVAQSESPLLPLAVVPFQDGSPLLCLTLNPNALPVWHPRLRSLIAESGLGLLVLLGALLVWAMGIRTRHVEARLELEHSRAVHLNELNVAAAGLAHETKNPLGLIRGLSQRLHASALDDPEQVRGLLEQIIDASDRATERLGEFLNFARTREPELTRLVAGEVVVTLAEVLRYDFEAVSVELRAQPAAATIVCDEAMLQQLLLNLLLNSLKASDPGDVVEVRWVTSGARRLTLVVEDHGRGIPADLKARAFEPYVTGSSDGNGLGLAIVRRIAEGHGWGVELESEEGVGTTIRVTGIEEVG